MTSMWDYLIVTASNDAQARAYEHQLTLRQHLGLIQNVREVRVIADPGGLRIGSGGSLAQRRDIEIHADSLRRRY